MSSLAFLCGCLSSGKSEDPGEKIVAQVYNRTLKSKEVNAFIPYESSSDDSLLIARSYIEKWVKEQLILREAEKYASKDLALDELVRRYRAALVLSHYEKEYVEKKLDTIINDDELQAYYESNKLQYQLETTIIRCRFLKIKQDITPKDKDFLQKNWKSQSKADRRYLDRICKEFGETCIFDENTWYKLEHIQSMLPNKAINKDVIQYNKEFSFKDNEYNYFLLIDEWVADKELAPLSFIREQARKFILHQRKLKLLDEMRERLYEQEILTDNVKIYVD
jgi:thymidine kinase